MIRFGLIGLGHFGKHYLRLLQGAEDVELCGVAARSEESIAKFGLPVRIAKYTDAQALLKEEDIDAVIIATPASTHFDLAKRAMEAGKHVLVEKPMALTLAEAEELRGIVKKSGRVFMVAHQYCCNDHIRYVKKEIDKGTLGKIRYLFFEHLYPGPIRPDIGCFGDSAPHAFSVIDYLFPGIAIRDIKGKMMTFGGVAPPPQPSPLERGRERVGDDFAAVEISYDNGLLATIVVSCFAAEKVRRMYLGGEKGMVLFDDMAEGQKIKIIRQMYSDQNITLQGGSVFFDELARKTETPTIPAQESLRNQLDHFIDCIRSGKTPLTDIEHGIRVTEAIELVYTQIRG